MCQAKDEGEQPKISSWVGCALVHEWVGDVCICGAVWDKS